MRKLMMLIIMMIFLLTLFLMDQRQLLIHPDPEVVVDAGLPDLTGTTFESFKFPEHFNIRKYEGITLNFIVENNLNANILSIETEEFTKLTGINVKIRPIDYDTFIQKINLDFISETGNYQLIYSDPYQTLNRFHDDLEVLEPYLNNPNLPNLQMPLNDFFENQLDVCSYFENRDNLYAIPFDSTTMILYYRKDVFENFKEAFMNANGYDWTPGGKDFTWERYEEISRWIDKYVPNEVVEYGSGQMAQAHNSAFCEFSNILASNGGDYFKDSNIDTLGKSDFSELDVLSPEFIKSLGQYKEIVKSAAPGSVNWNWTDTALAFENGKIAMMVNWDENYAALNASDNFRVRGNVGTALLPYGDVRSANIFGGSGIGINKYADDLEKEAAWFYITWATSKNMQYRILTAPTGGSMPTIKSAYEDISPEILEENPQISVVKNAWEPENIYLRPKLENFYYIEQILNEALHNMIVNDLNPELVAKDIDDKIMKGR